MKKYSDKTYQSVLEKVAAAGAPEFLAEYLIKVSSCMHEPLDAVIIHHLQPFISGRVDAGYLRAIREFNPFAKFPRESIQLERFVELLKESIPLVDKQYAATPLSLNERLDVIEEEIFIA